MPFLSRLFVLIPLALIAVANAEEIVFVTASSTEFNHPHDLTLDPSGNYLYVADMNNDSIKVLDPQSLKVLTEFGSGELNSPHDLTFSRKGELVVADSGNNRLVFYTVNKLTAKKIKSISDGLHSPEGVAVAENGDIFVANTGAHNIVHFHGEKPLKTRGKPGKQVDEFIRPHDLEIWNNQIIITDPGNNRVKFLDFELNNLRILDDSLNGFNEPKYLSMDLKGRLYVADQYNNLIKIFDNNNKLLATISSYTIDTVSHSLNKPEGIEARQGNIWISDTYHDRILLYKWLIPGTP